MAVRTGVDLNIRAVTLALATPWKGVGFFAHAWRCSGKSGVAAIEGVRASVRRK